MKKIFAAILAALMLLCAVACAESAMPAFNTVDTDGNAVDESIFAEAELTVLNIWGTYCGPCIREMPELAEWSRELPQNVRVMGLVVDVYSPEDQTYQALQLIMEKSGADFTNLLMDASLAPLVEGILGTPTTLFIDSEGRQVCEPVPGAYMDAYRANVDAWLADRG